MDEMPPEHDIAALVPPAQRALFRDCRIFAHEAVLSQVVLTASRAPGLRVGARIVFTQPVLRGRVAIPLGPGTADIRIETAGPVNLDIRTWRSCSLRIGEGTTVNSARIVCDNADVEIGRDGLWSDDILVQSNDQHGIIDLTTMTLTNTHRRRIAIADHVWIGRRAMVLPDTEIGFGSILAAGAILTAAMPARTIFAGVPARQVRANASWSRSSSGLSEAEQTLFGARLRPDAPEAG